MENQKSICCPVCGEALSDPYEIRDGTVCGACMRELRFAYPVIYVPNPHPYEQRRPDLKNLFEGENLTSRQKADRIEELRELPLNRVDPNPKSYYSVDRMRVLSIQEFKEQHARRAAIRNALLRRFDDYDNVCTVASVAAVPKLRATEGIQKMRLFRGTVSVVGTVRLGAFRIGNTVTVLRQGSPLLQAEILTVNYAEGCAWESRIAVNFGIENRKVVEGHQTTMILSPEAEGIEPGDLIVMDD